MHVDKPQSPLDWWHKTGAFWPLRSVLCLQVENDALKENNTSLLKGGVVGLGHLAQWTCAGHNERPRLPRWKILQWDNGPKPKKLTALKKGWEINTGLFLNGPPRAGIWELQCGDTVPQKSTWQLLRKSEPCEQMQTSHCEIQRSLYWRSLWSDLWKGINSFVHVCIFGVHCIQQVISDSLCVALIFRHSFVHINPSVSPQTSVSSHQAKQHTLITV